MNDNSYNNWSEMSDVKLMQTIGDFIQHHRLNQNRSQNEVAKSAGISRSTLSLMERGEKSNLNSLIQVLRVLDLLFVMDTFFVKQEISPVEYLKLQQNKRQRASGRAEEPNDNEPLEW